MTATAGGLILYAGALVALFLTPGPVWVALTARTLAGGFRQAWPLAAGVVLGDVLWPLVAILGLARLPSVWGGALEVLKWVAAAIFLCMGWLLIRRADRPPDPDGRLTRPGMWAGFAAGATAILGNPKAILFYMGVLLGFFDLRTVTAADVAAIVALSAAIPLVGNLAVALAIDRARRLLAAPGRTGRVNRGAGAALILVGLAIPFV